MLRLLAAMVAAAAMSCSNGSTPGPAQTNSTQSTANNDATAPAQPVADAAPQGKAMNQVVHQAKGAADLGAPLMQAMDDAESKGIGLRVELAAGDYGSALLGIEPMDSPSNVDVEVVAIGGPAVIHGSVKIEGRSVTVEGLVLDKPQVGASAIELRASDAIVIRGLAVLNALARDPDQEAIVELTSIGKGTTVSIERLWLVGNRLDSGGSLVTLATTGAGQLESATVSQSVFAGNRGGSGIATMFTRKVTIDRVAVIEPSLGKPWLDVRSPITQISLSNSTVATAKLARQSPSADSKPEDFPKIATAKVDLRGPSKKEHVDPSGATFGKAIKPPADWAFVTEPARKLEAPDIAKLTADL